MFEDVPFSYNRLKHSIIRSILYWAGIIPNVDTSFVRTLLSLYMASSRSLLVVGAVFFFAWPFIFCIGQRPPLVYSS